MQHSPRHAFSKLGWKARTGAVIGISAGALALGSALPASFASASSFGCNAQAGCATLHSVQPAGAPNGGEAISMDARYQLPTEKVIDYPDNKLDKATSFDKVPHTFRHGALRGDTYYTLVYAPTGDWSNMCVTAGAGGLLGLQVCTHGNSSSQQFIAGQIGSSNTLGSTITAPAVIPNFPGHREYVLENVGSSGLGSSNALPTSLGAIHLMENTYVGNPQSPSPVIPRGALTDGRQMDVNGSTTTSAGNGGTPVNDNAVVTLNANSALAHTALNLVHGSLGNHPTYEATNINVAGNAQWNWHT